MKPFLSRTPPIPWSSLALFMAAWLLVPALRAQTDQEPAPGSKVTRDIFVLVDVSGSMLSASSKSGTTREALEAMIAEARELVVDVAQGNFDPARYADWKADPSLLISPLREIVQQAPEKAPLAGVGKQLIVIPFGDKKVRHPQSVSLPLVNFPAGFRDHLDKHFPTVFKDAQTYVTIARAETSRVAESQRIDQYYFFMITDALQDPESGTGYTKEETDLLAQWDSTNFVAKKTRIGLFEYQKPGLEKRGFQVDVWSVTLRLPPSPSTVVLNSPALSQPLSPGPVELQWAIKDGDAPPTQPSGFTFSVSVVEEATGRQLHSQNLEGGYTTSVRLDQPGRYDVTILAAPTVGTTEGLRGPALGKFEGVLNVAAPAKVVELTGQDPGKPSKVGEEFKFTWGLISEGKPLEQVPGGKFEVSISREDEPVGSSTVNGYTQSFVPAKAGGHQIKITLVPGSIPDVQVDPFVFKFEVVKADSPTPPPAPDPTPVVAEKTPVASTIRILLPTPNAVIKSKPVAFKWTPPTGIKASLYQLKITGPESLDQKLPTTAFAKRFKKPGSYLLTLSVAAPADAAATVKPATVTFRVVESSSMGWLLPLVALGGATGFWAWRRNQKPKKKPATSEET